MFSTPEVNYNTLQQQVYSDNYGLRSQVWFLFHLRIPHSCLCLSSSFILSFHHIINYTRWNFGITRSHGCWRSCRSKVPKDLHWIWYLVSPILIVLLNANCKLWCSVTNVKCSPNIICHSLYVVLGIIDLWCCNYYHLPSDFSSKFQSSMTMFYHKLLTREGRVLANGWTHPSSMTIFVHLFIRSVILKVTTMT